MDEKINIVNNVEYKVLTVIVKRFGASLFDMNSFLGLEIEAVYAKSELKLALLSLCKKNKVISLRKIAGEKVYCVPFSAYIEHMIEISKANPPHLKPLDNVEENSELIRKDLVIDLIILLGWIGREQPKLNKKGQLDKKLVESFLQHIYLAPECLTDLMGKEATKLTYPISLGILLDLGLRLGTIHMMNEQFKLNSKQITQWLELAPVKMRLRIYHLWFVVHYPEQHEVRLLLVCLPLLPYSQWYSLEDLFKWIQLNSLGADITNETNEHPMESFLLMLQELGWIQLGQDRDGIRAIRSLIVDKQTSYVESLEVYWFVQPDYEIIVPMQIDYADHYRFNTYATLQSRNLMCTYRITKDSVFAAFEQGWTTEDVMKHLGSRARYGIPESIHISIMEWDQQYRGAQLELVMLLRCDTVTIAEQMMSFPEVGMILNEQSRIGPKVFLIPEEHVNFIREKMNAYGYRTDTVDKRNFVSHTMTPSNDEFEMTTGIFHSKIRYDMYTRDEQNYTIESLYLGLLDIPSGWMNTYVTYHISARRQLIQQAIDWQCYVWIALGGEEILFAPSLISPRDTMTHVEGIYRGKKLRMSLDQLGAMQLIVPGIHDVTKYMSTID